MKLVLHGAAREVGRSCIEVRGEDKRILLDCGLKLTEQDSEYPIGFEHNVDDIDAVFISHAHLDHTGALPWLDHKGIECPIFATKATKELSRVILRDAFKVGKILHQHLEYNQGDIKDVFKRINKVKIDRKGSYSGIEYEFFDAGHIPGAASVYVEIEGKKILYTGDIKNSDTLLLKGAETDFPEIDVMICESTYGDREHTSRPQEDEKFIDAVRETLKNGGTAIVPVFALGRSQEILLLLSKYNFKVPIYFDGMSNVATEIALENPEALRNAGQLDNAFHKVRRIKRAQDRKDALSGQSIIVTTSGMVTGGPVMYYLKYLGTNPKNSILLTGYQVKGTNGQMLMEEKKIFIDGWRKQVNCQVQQFDFSAHAGLTGLKDLVKKANPKKVVFVHGEERAVLNLHEWADAMGYESYAPKLGDEIEI